jgi:hypothetical protein
MHKRYRIVDAADFLLENYTEEQIELMRKHNIINSRVILAVEAKMIFNKQKSKRIMDKYEHTAMDMGISLRYVRRLLNE